MERVSCRNVGKDCIPFPRLCTSGNYVHRAVLFTDHINIEKCITSFKREFTMDIHREREACLRYGIMTIICHLIGLPEFYFSSFSLFFENMHQHVFH
jgi:hypothetical protein